ncbi:NAD(P)-dependent malic enzyme [Latilactobacillus fuchuensis]|uniref:NADP-dependent malic enzyme (Conversion of malate into pyruvate) n=1 Tax=Latilactobacillus fuchuensis TaxID=164393 RepID=A0A2N9DWR0_9LACO|nr:malic enzyme-like NAD(P)-binding protein [Latilactobacillus fuchuensis]SPC39112.1 NADP-dependent malic enzyme (conversion of malate into pyruvate) [Latilactobacillus fuchuensis]
MTINEEALALHAAKQGKIAVESTVQIQSMHDLALAYSPGVAEPCRVIQKDPETAYQYTAKSHLVGVISDGSAVLGLGNIGAQAAMPVMEGKSILFKQFGQLDAFPICLDTQDPAAIITAVQQIAPSFGGINLEDIASPKCFEIEAVLKKTLNIPVFHDDQHGTAVVVAAGLINALKLVHKSIDQIKVVLSGPGAAGTAIIKMLQNLGVTNIIAADQFGILRADDSNSQAHKREIAATTNPEHVTGQLTDAIVDADVFVGVSVAEALTPEMIRTMAPDPIIFALANPIPEVMPEIAKTAGAAIIATGRSDYPNQINNVLAFPGIFAGALQVRATEINEAMKVAAAYAIANYVTPAQLTTEHIMPEIFEPAISDTVAQAVAQAAIDSGVAQKGVTAK